MALQPTTRRTRGSGAGTPSSSAPPSTLRSRCTCECRRRHFWGLAPLEGMVGRPHGGLARPQPCVVAQLLCAPMPLLALLGACCGLWPAADSCGDPASWMPRMHPRKHTRTRVRGTSSLPALSYLTHGRHHTPCAQVQHALLRALLCLCPASAC